MSIRYPYPEKDPFWEKPFEDRVRYFDNEEKANDFLKYIVMNTMHNLDLQHNQEDWLFMLGELGKGRNPKLKGTKDINKENWREIDAISAINNSFNSAISGFRNEVVSYILRTFLHSDIDMSEDAIEYLFDCGHVDELIDFHQLIPEWEKNNSHNCTGNCE